MSVLKNAHALLIGISYEDGLDTIGDALDIAEVLKDESLCGYPPENVTLVTGAKADRNGILTAFNDLIARTDADSSIFLYYSGHGDVIDNTFHFVPYGIVEGLTLEEYSKKWVTADDIKDKINQLASKRLIFFMDCCHATGIARAGFAPKKQGAPKKASLKKGAPFAQLEGLAQKVDNERGISIVASCKEEQESYQLENDRNSLFTKHLLLALKGQHLTAFNDPFVRILEVASYLLRVIPPIIEEIGGACDPPLNIKQEPYVNLEMYDNFILSYVPQALREKQHVTLPSPARGKSPEKDSPIDLIYRETPGANNLVLFINGFTGEGPETFGHLPNLLMEDERLNGWDMKPFGYSKFVQPAYGKHVWGGTKDIDRICDYLCTSIKYKFEKYDRVAMVCHGFGGLIAQRALLDFSEAQAQKVSHLILMGCPSNGLPMANNQNTHSGVLEEIGSQGQFILRLRKDWNQKYGHGHPFVLKAIGATADEYVTLDSCFSPFAEKDCITVEGNHFSLVRPNNGDHSTYNLVAHCLTGSELFNAYGNAEEINLALGKYSTVANTLLPHQNELDIKGLKQLIFALEGLDRRAEALALLEKHELAQNNTDLMGIVGGRYKRNYLKVPTRQDGEAALVYYGLAYEMAEERKDLPQMYYLAINLAFLNLVVLEDRPKMLHYAEMAKKCALPCEDGLWKFATLGEANMYLGNERQAMTFYAKAAELAGVREKISMHLNASAGYAHLRQNGNPEFTAFLKELLLT